MSEELNSQDTTESSEPNGKVAVSPSGGGRFWITICGVLAVLVVMSLAFSTRGDNDEFTPEKFDKAWKLWDEKGPDNYDLTVEIGGRRAGQVEVEVRNGVVTKMTRDGQVPSQRRTWDVWSVPGQFDTIERELEMAADPEEEMQAERGTRLTLRGDFDQQYGYPVRFHRMTSGGGTEVFWEVTEFDVK